LSELKGKVIAFEDPTSTSAYFLPRLAFQKKGIPLVQLTDMNTIVPKDKVGYIFANQELNVSSWVYFKKVAAGAMSCLDWEEQDENPKAFRPSFKVIHRTEKVPRMVVMVRKGLDPMLVEQIKAILFEMHKSEKGKAALKSYKIDAFYELPESWSNLFNSFSEL
jgi:phosphonate transport system substrate-binding protein